MRRSTRKSELKKQRVARTPESGKKGFRLLVVGDDRYIYRIARNSVDIRRARDGKKIIVKHWDLFGLTQGEYDEKRWITLCGIPECTCGVRANQHYGARPGKIREYLQKEDRFHG